jgi:replicative DNA helicase
MADEPAVEEAPPEAVEKEGEIGHEPEKKRTWLDDRMPPHNVDAEEAFLGSLLIDPDAYYRVINSVGAADFYIQRNAWVFEAITALHDDREAVDFVTVCDVLERRGQLEEIGGAAYVTRLLNSVPTSINVEHYGAIVQRAAVRRRLIYAATEVAGLAYQEAEPIEEVVDRAEQIIFGVTHASSLGEATTLAQAMSDFYDYMDMLQKRGVAFVGLPTGFEYLDRLLGGMQASDLIIVAGRPGMGKTSLILNIMQNVAALGQRVLLFTLEMSLEQVVQRLISSEAGITSNRLRIGQLQEEEWTRLTRALSVFGEHDVLVDDTAGLTAMQMRARCRRHHMEKPLGLIAVDYLQLMRGDRRSENRVQEISYISRMLKDLARELNVPVIAASQLSRAVEQRHDKHPLLSDLRESGSIEQDADIVMFIYRDEMYNASTTMKSIAEIVVSKHRHGPTGVVELYFERELTRFRDLVHASAEMSAKQQAIVF